MAQPKPKIMFRSGDMVVAPEGVKGFNPGPGEEVEVMDLKAAGVPGVAHPQLVSVRRPGGDIIPGAGGQPGQFSGIFFTLALSSLEIPDWIRRALRAGGIKTVQDLLDLGYNGVFGVYGIGTRSMEHIIQALKERGIEFGPET